MNPDHLIKRLQEKDMSAFEILHGMYAENIMGAVNVIVKDPFIAEEITQDVFLKVWQQSDKYDPSKGRFFTWILNIGRNAAIDHWRSKTFKNNQKNLTADFFVDTLDSGDDLNSRMDALGVKNLLGGLKQKCIQIIELLYFKGFTQKDAAQELEIPLGTVKTRNRNCIGELRNNLGLS